MSDLFDTYINTNTNTYQPIFNDQEIDFNNAAFPAEPLNFNSFPAQSAFYPYHNDDTQIFITGDSGAGSEDHSSP
jgi:hypothetical protein